MIDIISCHHFCSTYIIKMNDILANNYRYIRFADDTAFLADIIEELQAIVNGHKQNRTDDSDTTTKNTCNIISNRSCTGG